MTESEPAGAYQEAIKAVLLPTEGLREYAERTRFWVKITAVTLVAVLLLSGGVIYGLVTISQIVTNNRIKFCQITNAYKIGDQLAWAKYVTIPPTVTRTTEQARQHATDVRGFEWFLAGHDATLSCK